MHSLTFGKELLSNIPSVPKLNINLVGNRYFQISIPLPHPILCYLHLSCMKRQIKSYSYHSRALKIPNIKHASKCVQL